MHPIAGIFVSRAAAEQAVSSLVAAGIPQASINYFTGECAPEEIQALRTTDAEAPGMGKAVGTFLGGAIGASTGLSVGTAVASVLIPGVGPIMAVGLGAAALLGAGGAAVGAKAGHESEDAVDEGIPKDDLFFYRDLLKQGRSVVVVNSGSESEAKLARKVVDECGAGNIDTARRQWRASHPEACNARRDARVGYIAHDAP